MVVAGINYRKPSVYLFGESGLGVSEYAGRTAYNSFNKSENNSIRVLKELVEADNKNEQSVDLILHKDNNIIKERISDLKSVEQSDLLEQLAHVYHHDSVLEHISLSYLVKDTSRGVLQEHARHRIQSITVQSTRYTMYSVINAYIASRNNINAFYDLIKPLKMFIITDEVEKLEIDQLFAKLSFQENQIGIDEFLSISLSNDNIAYIGNLTDGVSASEIYENLQKNKQKRNVGDNFKWVVTDNWCVDLVFTMNLRSLRNYLKLRDSGSAYFQIRELAKAVVNVTPQKYLDLISKKYKTD